MVGGNSPAASPMTEAVRRHSFDAAHSGSGVMDASGLQALAAAAVSAPPEAVGEGAARSGPRSG